MSAQRHVTDDEMARAVDLNAERIRGYGGEYGVPDRGPRHCKAGCGKEATFMGYCSPACWLDPNDEGY